MPKPLTEEPDHEPIHHQFIRLVREGGGRRPTGVVFSTEGQRLAMQQTVPGMNPWHHQDGAVRATHYMGVPYRVDPKQREDIQLETTT